MASGIPKRVHVLPIARDHDRVVEIFNHQMPDRVYILYNDNPLDTHNEVNEEILQDVRSLVQEKTMCGENGEIKERGVDFYRFEGALVQSFEIMYMEEKAFDNKVYANVSGGTKPMAIGLWAACALCDFAEPVYYPAEEYNLKNDGTVSSKGVAGSYQVATYRMLQMADLLPTQSEKQEIITHLLDTDHSKGVTDLLISLGKISDNTSDDSDKRRSIVQRYHRYANNLQNEGILNKDETEYELTEFGKLIARLVKTKRSIDKEIKEQQQLDEYFDML